MCTTQEEIDIELRNRTSMEFTGDDTPAILIADFSNVKAIKNLVESGVCVNICDSHGHNPLHLAIIMHSEENSCLESIIELISAGININWTTYVNETPLEYAVRLGHLDIVEVLILNGAEVDRKDSDVSLLNIAAAAMNQPLFKLLLDLGADVNFQDKDGTTALHLISWITDRVIILSVIARIGDINQRDANNGDYTFLHQAAGDGNPLLLKLLLEAGADISLTMDDNSTALHIAAEESPEKTEEVVKILLDNGSNIDARDEDGVTPLLLALENCNEKVIKIFSDYGADFTVKGVDGDSALHYAMENGFGEVAGLVLDKGVDINVKNDNGETALHAVAKCDNYAPCSVLLERGADILCKNKDGETALGVYVESKRRGNGLRQPLEIAELLMTHIAKLESLNFPIDQGDKKLIKRYAPLRQPHSDCKRELAKMKRTTVYKDEEHNGVTLHDILFASSSQMPILARNQNIVAKINASESDWRSGFPIYVSSMLDKFQDEIWNQRQMKKAQIVIGGITGLNSDDLICEKIVSFLEPKDLLKYYERNL